MESSPNGNVTNTYFKNMCCGRVRLSNVKVIKIANQNTGPRESLPFKYNIGKNSY